MQKKWQEIVLIFTYIAMLALCVVLNVFAAQSVEPVNIAVSIIMFVLVGIILVKCIAGSLIPAGDMMADLKRVTARIKQDAMNSHQYLWNKYFNDKETLFEEPVLNVQFSDYMLELDRIEHIKTAYYKCDIEDYIGYDLVDKVINRNMLNQVPGAMTGLGILGTFIGLSLGLQHFNTGSTAEITNSIAPLMGGIKVAFHTSIYGMIFSLVFNYAFKSRIRETEAAMGDFLQAYKKYVLPDTTTDGINKLMELQQQQTKAVNTLAETVGHELGVSLKELLEPQFDRFDHTITAFANVATQNQQYAMQAVTEDFISRMNASLGGSFENLKMALQATSKAQLDIISRVSAGTEELNKSIEAAGITASNLRQLSDDIRAIEGDLNKYVKFIADIQSKNSKELFDAIEAIHTTAESIDKISTSVPASVGDSYEKIDTSLKRIRRSLDILNDQIETVIRNIDK